MEKSKNPEIILDTDIILNWLLKEAETTTGENLWSAPYEIVKHIGDGNIEGFINLVTILETRYVLRRKKQFDENIIKSFINDIIEVFEVLIPDEVCLLRANNLQEIFPLDPFDAIILSSISSQIRQLILITRDDSFKNIAVSSIEVKTPEEFIQQFLNKGMSP